jgi:putative peptide zinc metalloprotease protein
MEKVTPASEVERRKQVRIRIRSDLGIAPQKYEGKTYYVVKDPVSLRYYRFEEQEHFIIQKMNGRSTLDETQKEFEKRFRPKRLTLEDLEHFAQQLLTAGLAHNESPKAGTQLYDRRKKRKRNELLQYVTNILYIKIPVFDPDKLLDRMLPPLRWIFTTWFFALSCGVMLGAVILVLTHFEAFVSKLPDSHTFFQFGTLMNLWFALGLVKVIHEFGHGLSCKAFGGEVHEMGALFLCLSPCLYCNVSDAWTLPNKWRRIIISFAGIYVELIIAAFATFYWWNSKPGEFWNELSLSLMIVCSVSTILFNANPLMRFDGYYVMADWLEIPNLRDRSNRFLSRLVQEHCLGIEVQPEPYMSTARKIGFVTYAITSYIYRWVITFSILIFFTKFLTPYGLQSIGYMIAVAAAASMVGWPVFRLGKAIHRRGRLPDMKSNRVTACVLVVLALVLAFLFLPLPVSRVRNIGMVQIHPDAVEKVHVPNVPGSGLILERMRVRDGQHVNRGQVLAEFRCLDVDTQLEDAKGQVEVNKVQERALREQRETTTEPEKRAQIDTAITTAIGNRLNYEVNARDWEEQRNALVLRAPRDGIVMSCPKKDEVGKVWDKEQGLPFCSVGDPSKLQALVPVPPPEYRLLKEELEYDRQRGRDLPVTMRVQGFADKTWKGHVALLQESEAKEVPPQLTNKFGGPLAVRQTGHPGAGAYTPQSQHFLVSIDFLQPDEMIHPGTLARVKMHCRWRPCAWWVWRTVSSTFNLGLNF